MRSEREASTCSYSASRSLASLGVATTSIALPVFAAQAWAAARHISSSWPTAPHDSRIVAAAAGAAPSSAPAATAAPGSAAAATAATRADHRPSMSIDASVPAPAGRASTAGFVPGLHPSPR